MKNSKLIELLRTFSAKERRSFRDMAASSYFNRNQDVTRLADWLDTFAPEYSGATRAGAQAFLFPEEVPDEARLNHLMSFLLKLAENFVGLEIYQNNTFPAGLDMLQAFSDRGLDKHYHFQLEKLRRELDAEAMPDTSFFYNVYAVEILEAQRTALRSPRQFNAGVQKATDHLDTFYLLEKLKRTCYMYTSQAILATPYNLHLVEEICRFAGAHLSEMPTPAIEAYYRIFQLLSKPEADEDFAALKALLAARAQEFNQED
ncbi:MAG: hypothetical protein JNJ57_09670, partial [Saprospiraceae bacterium]|nr:hypothetical protein [Saprospiraceae bacterium]